MDSDAANGPACSAGMFAGASFPARKRELLRLTAGLGGSHVRHVSLMPDRVYSSPADAAAAYASVSGAAMEQAVDRLGPWFHNLHLPDGTSTAPDHFLGDFPSYKWDELRAALPDSLDGWSVLDIGCNAGFYCIELARRGAAVTGIDADRHYLDQARWAAGIFGLSDRITFREMQVYDLMREDKAYDLVLFLGVLYHLRYPLLGLDIVARTVRRRLLFQTLSMPGEAVLRDTYDRDINDRTDLLKAGWPKMAFIEHAMAGDPTNWWLPNHACIEAMLRSCGMRVLSRPGHEMYVCEPDPDHPSSVATWNAQELAAATGGKTTAKANGRGD